MDKLKQLYENYKTTENNIVNYFGLEEMPPLCDMGEISKFYWFVDNQSCLNFAKEKEMFETGEYYCLDGGCDEEVCGRYEMDGYVALILGVGEHHNGRFEIFMKDKEIEMPDYME